MSSIAESYARYVNCARGLPNFIVGQKEDVPYDITELANGYCAAKDANDQIKMSQYISALMVRYWHVAVLIYNKSLFTRLEFEDILSWVYEGFDKAFKYRSWLDESKEVSKDPKGAEKVINRCIFSVQQYWYYTFNLDKHKINFITSSLDDSVPGKYNEEQDKTVLDTLEDPEARINIDNCRELVQKFIDKGDLTKAIILDAILYQDCFVDKSKMIKDGVDEEGNKIEHYQRDFRFAPSYVIKHLRNLNSEFVRYFIDTYIVSEEELIPVVDELKSKCSPTLHNWLNKTIDAVKKDKEILRWLCM